MRKIQWPRESDDVVFPKQPNGSAYVVLHRQLVYLESNKTSLINSLLAYGISNLIGTNHEGIIGLH